MGKIILSADSPCDLNEELKQQYDVHYFPYYIDYRGESYIDNVTITPAEIYAGYREDGSLPKTAASSPGDYEEYFKQFTDEGNQVIHFSLGGALSIGCENAQKAAEELEGVYVIDSFSLSTGIGQQVIRAGRLIEQGLPIEEIVQKAKELRGCVHASFILDTLDFMAAGGRCPGILAHVGKALKFKPEIIVDNTSGSMSVGKLYRGKLKKALQKYTEDTLDRYPDIIADDIFITYSTIEDELVDVAKEVIREKLPNIRIHVSSASCTIGSHCGPNTIGVLFVTKTPSA